MIEAEKKYVSSFWKLAITLAFSLVFIGLGVFLIILSRSWDVEVGWMMTLIIAVCIVVPVAICAVSVKQYSIVEILPDAIMLNGGRYPWNRVLIEDNPRLIKKLSLNFLPLARKEVESFNIVILPENQGGEDYKKRCVSNGIYPEYEEMKAELQRRANPNA